MALKHRWKDRVFEYDWAEQRRADAELAARRREARQRQIRLAGAMQKIGMVGLEEMLQKIAAGVPLRLSIDEIANLAAAGQKLERESLGEDRDDVLTKLVVKVVDGDGREWVSAGRRPRPRPLRNPNVCQWRRGDGKVGTIHGAAEKWRR
jgi:hypothetical protein